MEFDQFSIRLLEYGDIPQVLDMTDVYLGEHMYSASGMEAIINSDKDFFYVIEDDQGIVGIFCFQVLIARDIVTVHGFAPDVLEGHCDPGDKIAIYRGFVLLERARGKNLASRISAQFMRQMFEQEHITLLIAAAWIKGDEIPAKHLLERNGMKAGARMPRAWYSCTQMYCPYCKQQPCICDALFFHCKKEDLIGEKR